MYGTQYGKALDKAFSHDLNYPVLWLKKIAEIFYKI
jgi:hypothetical protein